MQDIFTAAYWPLSGDTSLFYSLNSSICNTQNQDKEVIWIEHPAGILSYWRYHGVLFYSNKFDNASKRNRMRTILIST